MTSIARRPPALKPGDTIGIMAPSSRIDKTEIASAVKILESHGFKVCVHPQARNTHGQSAGTGQEKADALHDLYRNPDIRAVFAAGGGNRAWTMLEKLDFRLLKKNPKILIGYSDVTALLLAVNKKTGMPTFHGPTACRFGKPFGEKQISQCFNLLRGKKADVPLSSGTALQKGKASGRLVGGNLSLICSLMGTPYEPDFKGSILFLEDCGDELSRIDRMFGQLRNAGVFDKISGLILGGFTDLKDTGTKPFGLTLKGIVNEAVAGKNIPVIVMGAPFGHKTDLFTMPIGHSATLTTRGGPRLKLDGPAVAL